MIFLWIAIAFIASVLVLLLHQDWQLWSRPSRRTMGRVFDHRKKEDEGIFYMARVEFTDAQGKAHVIEDSLGGQTPMPPVGGTLEVEYSEASPHKGRVRRPLLRGFLYSIMLCMLALLLAKALGWIKG